MSEFLAELAEFVPGDRAVKLRLRRTYAHCLRKGCGSFKSRPSALCPKCGDDPVTHNGDRRAFDRAYDWPY